MNSSRSNYSDYCLSIKCLFSMAERTAIISVFSLLFVVSFAGNILILFLLKRDRQLRSKTSPSHISLAVADLLVTIFCLPFMVTDIYIVERWIFGAAFCKIITFSQTLSSISSILNLLIVTCECFTAVCFPIYLRLLKRKRVILIVCCATAWSIALAESIVYVQFKELQILEGTPYCLESWPSVETHDKFIYSNVILISILPICLITILNMISVTRLCQAQKWDIHSNRISSKSSYTRTATKKIISISLIFVVSRTPHQVYSLPFIYTSIYDVKAHAALHVIVYVLYFFSASTHPVVFSLMSSYYRDAIRRQWMYVRPRNTSKASFRGVQSSRIVDTNI